MLKASHSADAGSRVNEGAQACGVRLVGDGSGRDGKAGVAHGERDLFGRVPEVAIARANQHVHGGGRRAGRLDESERRSQPANRERRAQFNAIRAGSRGDVDARKILHGEFESDHQIIVAERLDSA